MATAGQLVPIFTLKLQQRVAPRLVCVGRYDGQHASLTAATTGGKVGGRLLIPNVAHHNIGRFKTSTTSARV